MSMCKYNNSKALSAAGKKLYLEEETADVHFVFESKDGGESERVPAHKILLTAVSEVFRAMFNGTWKEKNEVPIVDAKATGFKEFLQFFYLDEVKLTAENIEEVTNLGKMYLMTECVKICGQFLQDNLTVENICTAYGIATVFDIDELIRLCEAYISINAAAVLKSPGFMKCDKETVDHILKLDTLSCPETDVFEACMAWVKAASKQDTLTKEAVQTHLGDSFYDIRFGSMKMDEFAAIFDSYSMTSIFSADEHKEIVQMITTDKYKPKFFNANRRKEAKTEKLICKRTTECVHAYFIKKSEVTTFSTNANLILKTIVGTELQDFEDDCPEHLGSWACFLDIEEIREVNGEEVSQNLLDDEQISFNDEGHTRFRLPEPLIVRRGLKYRITFMMFDDSMDDDYTLCTDFEYTSDEVEIEPGIVVKFHDRKMGGVIRALEFNRI